MVFKVNANVLTTEFWEASECKQRACRDAVESMLEVINDIFEVPFKSIIEEGKHHTAGTSNYTDYEDLPVGDLRAQARAIDSLTTIKQLQLHVLQCTVRRKEEELKTLAKEKRLVIDEVDRITLKTSYPYGRHLPQLPTEVISKIFGMLATLHSSNRSRFGEELVQDLPGLLKSPKITKAWRDVITAEVPIVFIINDDDPYFIADRGPPGFKCTIILDNNNKKLLPRIPSKSHHYLVLSRVTRVDKALVHDVLKVPWKNLMIQPRESIITILKHCRAILPQLHSLSIKVLTGSTPQPSEKAISSWTKNLPAIQSMESNIRVADVDTRNLAFCLPWFANLTELRLDISAAVAHLGEFEDIFRSLPSTLTSLTIYKDIGRTTISDDGANLSKPNFPNLRHLTIKRIEIDLTLRLLRCLASPRLQFLTCKPEYDKQRGDKDVFMDLFRLIINDTPNLAEVQLAEGQAAFDRVTGHFEDGILSLLSTSDELGEYPLQKLEHLDVHFVADNMTTYLKAFDHYLNERSSFPGVARLKTLVLRPERHIRELSSRLCRSDVDFYLNGFRNIIPLVNLL